MMVVMCNIKKYSRDFGVMLLAVGLLLPAAPVQALTVWLDNDRDGYGDFVGSAGTILPGLTVAPAGFSTNQLDHEDLDPMSHPMAYDKPDGIDNNFDGMVDEFNIQNSVTFSTYLNAHPGFFSQFTAYSINNGDNLMLDGSSSSLVPFEISGDSIDNNMNGLIDETPNVPSLPSSTNDIVRYTWDLDGNGVDDFVSLNSTLTLTSADYDSVLALVAGGNQFTGRLTVVDRFGVAGSANFSLNITAVPIPAAAWLFGSGLLGLLGIARSRKSASLMDFARSF